MITCRSNPSGLAARLRALDRNRPDARKSAALAMAHEVVRVAVVIAPKDTNRYVNGFAQAANKAGAGPISAPPIRASRVHDEIVRKLRQQAAFWEFIVRDAETKGRTLYRVRGKSGETKSYRKAKQNLAKAREQLKKVDPTSIAFGLRGSSGRSLNLTVRNKIYGGTGEVVETPAVTFVRLHNLEAHATIVEKKFGVMKKAGAVARAMGARSVGRAYFKKVTGRAS